MKQKIFLASSIDEFSDERKKLKDFTRRLRDVLIDSGIHLELFLCEYADNEISFGRKQDEYNKQIDDSDIFIMLIGEKLGEYTLEEYEHALRIRRENGRPKMLAAYMSAGVDDETVTDFSRRSTSDNVDQITIEMLAELKKAMVEIIAAELSGAAEFQIVGGRVVVNGKVAAKL